jgi:hypothetical protein
MDARPAPRSAHARTPRAGQRLAAAGDRMACEFERSAAATIVSIATIRNSRRRAHRAHLERHAPPAPRVGESHQRQRRSQPPSRTKSVDAHAALALHGREHLDEVPGGGRYPPESAYRDLGHDLVDPFGCVARPDAEARDGRDRSA